MAGLGDYPVGGVLRAENFERARRFYTEVLGLEEVGMPGPGGQGMFRAGMGSVVTIYERPGMPAPANTTLGFGVAVDQFDSVIAELRGKGVVFEDYDIPEVGLKTVNGIAQMEGTKAAWLTDTEGNIISINSM
jgi:catechol 2,3-dioxygenase-like lactoylglutathione lyase family enzyme